MSRRWIRWFVVVGVAAGWLAASGSAEAQRRRGGYNRGGGYYQNYQGGYWGNPNYYGPGGYGYGPYDYGNYGPNRNYWGYGNYQYSPQYYESFYPPAADYSDAAPGSSARVFVRVPSPNTQVFIEGQPMNQTGAERMFTSPPLEPGYTYTYHLRARWRQDGRDMDQTRTVEVQPGQQATVDFTQPPQSSRPPDADR